MRLLVLLFLFVFSGCAVTLPADYTAKGFQKLPGVSATMGQFSYAPYKSGRVRGNQIRNTAMGRIFIGEDVDKYVRRATALELANAGVVLEEHSNRIEADVNELVMDDLGFSVDYEYEVTYRILSQEGQELFARTYSAEPRATGKFGSASDYVPILNAVIRDCIEQFLGDIYSQDLLKPSKVDHES